MNRKSVQASNHLRALRTPSKVLVICRIPLSSSTQVKAKRRVTSFVGTFWLLLSALRWSEILAWRSTKPWKQRVLESVRSYDSISLFNIFVIWGDKRPWNMKEGDIPKLQAPSPAAQEHSQLWSHDAAWLSKTCLRIVNIISPLRFIEIFPDQIETFTFEGIYLKL